MDLKIACPKCDWEPSPSDMWQCSCGHNWHTFDTGGRCPACNKQWAETCCYPPFLGGCALVTSFGMVSGVGGFAC